MENHTMKNHVSGGIANKFYLKQVVNALPLKENLNRHFQMFSRSNSNARYVDFCIQEKIP